MQRRRTVQALRVLVAEDEASVVTALEGQLRALGCELVGPAATGREAVELAAKSRPDMVLMDIKMPDMDGIEAARMIAEQSPAPVVFLSGYFSAELLEEVVNSGGMAYLLKPASAEQLQAAFNLARKRFGEMRDLRQQVEKLKEALEARKAITRAKGILMARQGIGEEEAHRQMQKEASRRNMKLVDLARAILAASSLVSGRPGGGDSR